MTIGCAQMQVVMDDGSGHRRDIAGYVYGRPVPTVREGEWFELLEGGVARIHTEATDGR